MTAIPPGQGVMPAAFVKASAGNFGANENEEIDR
jgi:hypothetical protein